MSDSTIDPFTGSRYKLEHIAACGDLEHWRLSVPGSGRLQSTDLVFTGQHTVICGDLAPGRNGVVSSYGIGRAFFSQRRGARYLAEKFLSQGWHPVLAHAELDAMALADRERFAAAGDDLSETLARLHGMIYDGDTRGICDWFSEHGWESEDMPGYGYDPACVALLSAINDRFATLYAEWCAERARVTGGEVQRG